MIVWKEWQRHQDRTKARVYYYEGWFLFGIFPLYIRRQGVKQP